MRGRSRQRRSRRRRPQAGVELNLAAMLDMAFQMLMFFILTFNPGVDEAELAAELPAPFPITQPGSASPRLLASPEAPSYPNDAIVITALGDSEGNLKDLAVESEIAAGLKQLAPLMQRQIQRSDIDVKQVVLQVDARLNYQSLMSIVDACTEQVVYKDDAAPAFRLVELRTSAIK
jgi:biopolymer transport protein ExbD